MGPRFWAWLLARLTAGKHRPESDSALVPEITHGHGLRLDPTGAQNGQTNKLESGRTTASKWAQALGLKIGRIVDL